MKKPNFLVIGASKCGTTAICSYLREHPQVFVPASKGTWFFLDDKLYHDAGWQWYSTFFNEGTGALAIGEGTDRYSWRHIYPKIIPRIVNDMPETRLIYIVRHPLRQIESLWMELISSGEENKHFSQAVYTNPHLMQVCRYGWQIKPFAQQFDKEKILILFFEDMVKDLNGFMQQVYQFLDVDDQYVVDGREARNVSIGKKHHDRKIIQLIRNLPVAKKIDRQLQGRIRQTIKPFLRKSFLDRPQWDSDLMRWVLNQIKIESVEFLINNGKPDNFWNFDG